MIAVFTHYTANGLNPQANWPSVDLHHRYFQKSVQAALLFFKTAIIFTDSINEVKPLFSSIKNIQLIPIDFHREVPVFPASMWNLPKIIVYKKMADAGKPFLHIDNDLLLHTQPQNLKARVVCEGVRNSYQPTWRMAEIGITPSSDKVSNCMDIACSGILGGTDLEVFRQLYNRAIKVVNHVVANPHITIRYEHLFLMEEYILTGLVGIENIKTVDCEFTHYQGKSKQLVYAD